jgi:hypothetical protein
VVLARKTGAGAIRRPVLVALGLRPDGKKEVIDFCPAQSKSAAEWERFLGDLIRRGLDGDALEMICVDGGSGLLAALPTALPGTSVQRCWAHKMRNVLGRVRRADQPVVNDLQAVMNSLCRLQSREPQPERQHPSSADTNPLTLPAGAVRERLLLSHFFTQSARANGFTLCQRRPGRQDLARPGPARSGARPSRIDSTATSLVTEQLAQVPADNVEIELDSTDRRWGRCFRTSFAGRRVCATSPPFRPLPARRYGPTALAAWRR